MTRHIDAAGSAAIKRFESCRLEAYRDAVGVWTIGWGSTRGVTPGMTITQSQADQRFDDDLAPAETAVSQFVTVPLTDNQYAALVSFVFNCGAGTLRTSTMLRLLNGGNYAAVPSELQRFHFAHGISLAGLVTRRKDEAALWNSAAGQATSASITDKPATPAAAAPASPPVADHQKAPPMTAASSTIVSGAETAAVDVFAGIKNLFGFVKTGLESGTKVATSGGVAASALGNVVSGVENMVTGDNGAAISAIESFIADIEAKKWGSLPHDVLACLKTGFAILAKFGVNVPIAGAVIAALPDIPAI